MTKKGRQRAKKKQQAQKKLPSLQAQRPPKEESPRQPLTQRKSWRIWLFRFVGVFIIPVLLLLGLELWLRVFDYGVPTGFTYTQEVDGQRRILSNPHFTWRFFPPQLAKEGSHFSRPLKKPPGTYRVFVFGGSAAQGAPAMAYGMTRILDTMLRDQYPGVDFDVINAAITAINSHVVLPIVRDCSQLEPDLFVVYLGNNEVVGPYGAGTIFSPLASSLSMIRAGIALKATRLGQLVSNTIGRIRGTNQTQPGNWGGMEMFLNNQVRADDPGMETVYRHFKRNLVDISGVAQRSDIPIIVSTVGVNLKDSAPFASLHRPEISEDDIKEWDRIVQEGGTLREEGKFQAAIERFLEAEKIDADYAALHFRLGRGYWAMGDFEQAKTRYVKARELDALRFRADTRINEIIRNVSGGKSEQGIHLVDASRVLEANSPENTPGNELFYEHVHMNFRGTYLVARTIFEQVQRVLPEWVSRHASERAVLSEQESGHRLAHTSWNRLMNARSILNLMQAPPFTNQLDTNRQVKALSERIEALQALYDSREGKREVLRQYKAALDTDGAHWSLHNGYAEYLYKGLNNAKEAEEHLRVVIKHCPQSALTLFLMGNVLSSQGKHDEAEEYYRKSLIYNPLSTSILSYFGTFLLQQGRPDPAIRYLEKAIEIDPLNAMAHSALGVALEQSDDPGSHRPPIWHLRKALDIDPSLIRARKNLVRHYTTETRKLITRGEDDRARELLRQAIELQPNATAARYNLAVLLNRKGDRKAALDQLSRVMWIDPNHREARRLFRRLSVAGR
ncbi:MAG: tetratricopeptide repeat protein [Desulfobacterales bacterium]